jgi:hypothetical protein
MHEARHVGLPRTELEVKVVLDILFRRFHRHRRREEDRREGGRDGPCSCKFNRWGRLIVK